MVEEQLQHGTGVGVIMSPRDLAMQNAVAYSQVYHDLGSHVLIDQQFYEPSFSHPKLASYPINEYRTTVSQLRQIRDDQLSGLASSLEQINRNVAADGVIAPALVYQAGRPDIAEVNARLFGLAKQVGDSLWGSDLCHRGAGTFVCFFARHREYVAFARDGTGCGRMVFRVRV